MIQNRRLMLSILLVALCVCQAKSQTKSLFNGINLEGWQVHGTETWFVKEGELVSESGQDKAYGYLSTTDNYDNFELTLEFLQESIGNSGVFIRSSIEGVKIRGWQVEVAPKGLHTGGIYESYGRGWLIKPELFKEEVLKEGEWNTLKILVNGDQLTTWLNGTEMVNFTDKKIGKGKGFIALQIHDGGGIKVRWRNINIKEL